MDYKELPDLMASMVQLDLQVHLVVLLVFTQFLDQYNADLMAATVTLVVDMVDTVDTVDADHPAITLAPHMFAPLTVVRNGLIYLSRTHDFHHAESKAI